MGKVRVADYIADYLYSGLGVEDIFLVTGGGAMFLNDGVAKHHELNAICNHHEQASAMGAVAYSKYKNSYAVAMTTSGCGATNAITGLLDAWQDNTPVIFISGQVKRKETVHNAVLELRQVGVQEVDIIPVVSSLSKYSVMINEPREIAYHLEKAAFLAMSGRPGPVWIDIPQDVQGALVEESELIHFDQSKEMECFETHISDIDLSDLVQDLQSAKRPVILAGNGIRLGNSIPEFKEFISKYNIPVVTTYLGIDLLASSDAHNIGRVGIKGDRAGNFAIQNSDFLLVLGSRLSVAVTGFEYELFARESKVVVIDIDPIEHQKNTVKIDKLINCDVKNALLKLNLSKNVVDSSEKMIWLESCLKWREKWPVAQLTYEVQENKVNTYTFIKSLERFMQHDSAVVADAGSAYYVTAQGLKLTDKQRYITSGAQADMGFTIPAAIGVSIAKRGEVLAITGEGSFQMNIQELQTIIYHNLPIKIFVLNNGGYLSIRTTQNKFFEGRLMGTEDGTGISFPELDKIATAYGCGYFCAHSLAELDDALERTIAASGPVICEVFCPENQEIIPTVSAMKKDDGTMVSKPFEDMYPFLDREEFISEMIVEAIRD